jgi:hypothetical protein
MGSKNKYLIFILFFLFPSLNAQEKMDYRNVDSLTYSYYKSGEWNKLISLGEAAIGENIDYKYLRERLGYAFFVQGDYYNSKFHFKKALTFDSYDQFSLEYLYYSYLNTGNDEYAGVSLRRFTPELRKSLSIKPFKALTSIELEYDFKKASTVMRSNPQYYRLGITTKLGYRFALYQSYSGYYQTISVQQNGGIVKVSYSQPEYYVLLNYCVSNQMLVKTAYHFIHNSSRSSVTNGNLFFLAMTQDLNRFSFEINSSVLTISQEATFQAGVHAGYVFPGRSGFYLNGTLSGLFQQNGNGVIYAQKAGLKVNNKLWLEGNVTFGKMTGYNDYNGLYVYNLYDPMTFRCGTTLYLLLNRNISIWTNIAYESKEYAENNSIHYNQFSYLGGIKWKL